MEFNNNKPLARYIYGKMKYYDLPIDNTTARELEQIAEDYCLKKSHIVKVISNASNKYAKNINFDYLSFIAYELINVGKEESRKG